MQAGKLGWLAQQQLCQVKQQGLFVDKCRSDNPSITPPPNHWRLLLRGDRRLWRLEGCILYVCVCVDGSGFIGGQKINGSKHGKEEGGGGESVVWSTDKRTKREWMFKGFLCHSKLREGYIPSFDPHPLPLWGNKTGRKEEGGGRIGGFLWKRGAAGLCHWDCSSGNPWISQDETGGRPGRVRDLVRQRKKKSQNERREKGSVEERERKKQNSQWWKDLKCLLFHFLQYVFCIQVLLKEECAVYNYKRVCSPGLVYVLCECARMCVSWVLTGIKSWTSAGLWFCCSSCQMWWVESVAHLQISNRYAHKGAKGL